MHASTNASKVGAFRSTLGSVGAEVTGFFVVGGDQRSLSGVRTARFQRDLNGLA